MGVIVSLQVRFHDNRQVFHTSQDDRGVELAHVFERRCIIIDAAIVKMLKREKRMSIDNVVLKVWGWGQEFVGPPTH